MRLLITYGLYEVLELAEKTVRRQQLICRRTGQAAIANKFWQHRLQFGAL